MKRLSILLLFALTACTTLRIDMPEEAWSVEGANPRRWNAPISFGPYRTATVNEGTRRSWLADTGILQIGRADQGYHLTINELVADCHTKQLVLGREGVFVDTALGREPMLVCGFERPNTGTRSVLALTRTGNVEPTFRGELRQLGGPALEVRSIHRAMGSSIPSGEPFGFEILEPNGDRVAIVETANRGRVWIDRDARANQDVLAAAMAALLLFEEPGAGE